jgi:D-glycero-D-manno-heptose 1,7-bisphosphate phosphatase
MKLIVLDRDGTLNPDPEDYLRGPEQWHPLPGALEAVARLNQGGWRVVIATNQSGLGRGLFDVATLNAVHARMHKLMAAAGARVDAVFFCPHSPEDGCDCRKPHPGLLLQIAQRFGVAPLQMLAVGDSVRDAQAAASAGCEPHLVLTGQSAHLLQERRGDLHAVQMLGADWPAGTRVHRDLPAFAEALLSGSLHTPPAAPAPTH